MCGKTDWRGGGSATSRKEMREEIKFLTEKPCFFFQHRVYQKHNMKNHMKVHTNKMSKLTLWCDRCKQVRKYRKFSIKGASCFFDFKSVGS